MTQNPLTTLRPDIEAHWRAHRPVMVAQLEAEGRLKAAIEAAATQTEEAVQNAVATGTPFWDAWQTFREEWAFLPKEEAESPLAEDDFWQIDLSEEDGDDDVHWLTKVGFYEDDEIDDDDLFDPYADDDDEAPETAVPYA